MKKISTLITMALVAIVSLSLTSCDEDDMIADTLAGTWRGKMYVSSEYDDVIYTSIYTTLGFDVDPYSYSSGTGYWIDTYDNAPFVDVANHTKWTVRNGVIYIRLIEEGSDVEIRDYRLDDGYFEGTIYYGDQRVDFRMYHLDNYNYNWRTAYSKQATTRSTADSTEIKVPVRSFGK